MNGLNYLLQTNLYLLLFMGFYVLVLRYETFFRQNRFFLNTSIFLSFLIPFINSDWFRDLFITQKVREVAVMPSRMMYDTIIVGIKQEAPSFSLSDAIFLTYCAGATFLLLRFLIRLTFLGSNLKVTKGTAFSFFKTLVVDKDIPKAETIIDHEKVHMRQWHSVDIIFIELASIVNWFNPVMYIYKKEIRHIHEFIADEEAANLMQSKADYAVLLFSNTLGVDPYYLSNNFFNRSLLKRRIHMLHKTKSKKTGLWKYGFSAPLFVLMLIVSAALASSKDNALSIDGEGSITSFESLGALALPHLTKAVFSGKKLSAESGRQSASSWPALEKETSLASSASELKRHLAATIKYTATANAAKAIGYIQVNFMVKSKQITDVEITKSLHADLDKEVLNAFASFNSEIELPDNDYAIVVVYADSSLDPKSQESIPESVLLADNCLGFLLGFVKDGEVRMATISTMGTNTLQDQLPHFPGGTAALNSYITKNIKYPEFLKVNNISGRVVLSFVVDTDGSIENIKVLRGIGGGADEEAVRLIAQSPKWIPGRKNGTPVKSAFTMPIAFALNGKPLPRNPSVDPGPVSTNRPLVKTDVFDFAEVDVLPEFPGGMAGWGKYLKENLKYPELAQKNSITGRVIMSFVVEKDGSLSNVKVLRGIGGGTEEESIRILKNSPKWKPGLANGDPVRVAYTMPIFYQQS